MRPAATGDEPTSARATGGLQAADVRHRAAGGAALLALRGVVILVLGLGANILLARMLVPSDFGLVAIGNVAVIVGRLLTDGGFGAALIKRSQAPERADLEAVQAAQLALTTAIAGGFFLAALPFGRAGLVPATITASLPIMSVRLPQTMVFERDLAYRAIATTDTVEAASYYIVAIAGVAAGLGVWGLAVGFIARAVLGSATMITMSPLGFIRPRWSTARLRPLLRFGIRFQATVAGYAARDQGVNLGVGALAGVGTLGVWSFAVRILQVPSLLLSSLVRVAYPAMARLVNAGEDPRALIERAIQITALVTGVMLTAMISSAPAFISLLTPHRWHEVPVVLLWAGVGITISSPVFATVEGYLFAVDRSDAVLRAVILETLAWWVVTFSLVRSVGVVAVGLGSLAAAIVELAVMSRAAGRASGARVLTALSAPLIAALIAESVGWLLASSTSPTVADGLMSVVVAEGILVGTVLLLRRRLLGDALRVIRRAVWALALQRRQAPARELG